MCFLIRHEHHAIINYPKSLSSSLLEGFQNAPHMTIPQTEDPQKLH